MAYISVRCFVQFIFAFLSEDWISEEPVRLYPILACSHQRPYPHCLALWSSGLACKQEHRKCTITWLQLPQIISNFMFIGTRTRTILKSIQWLHCTLFNTVHVCYKCVAYQAILHAYYLWFKALIQCHALRVIELLIIIGSKSLTEQWLVIIEVLHTQYNIIIVMYNISYKKLRTNQWNIM